MKDLRVFLLEGTSKIEDSVSKMRNRTKELMDIRPKDQKH